MLQVTALAYRYPDAPGDALTGIELAIQRGEILGVLGPNGAGKTTLLSLLAGVLAIQSGRITIDGEPLAEFRRRRPRALAWVPQDYALYPMLTARENLRFFAGLAGLSGEALEKRVMDCAAIAQLQRFLDRRAERLSGGLKRRLNLAIGLLADPDFLLLDEPTVGVDPQSRGFLLETVASLKGEGKAILYCTHHMEEVEQIGDRIAIFDEGRIIRSGDLASLLTADVPRVRFTLEVPLPETARAHLAERFVLAGEGRDWTAECESGEAVVALLGEIGALGLPVARLQYGHQNLESLFMALTKRSLRD